MTKFDEMLFALGKTLSELFEGSSLNEEEKIWFTDLEKWLPSEQVDFLNAVTEFASNNLNEPVDSNLAIICPIELPVAFPIHEYFFKEFKIPFKTNFGVLKIVPLPFIPNGLNAYKLMKKDLFISYMGLYFEDIVNHIIAITANDPKYTDQSHPGYHQNIKNRQSHIDFFEKYKSLYEQAENKKALH